MERAAAIKFLRGDDTETNQPQTSISISTPQLSEEQTAEQLRKYQQSRPIPVSPNLQRLSGDAGFVQENTQTDAQGNVVPLDIETGAPSWVRYQQSWIRDRKLAERYLQDMYGKENVRLSTEGTPIVRVVDEETGKPKDLLVDEKKMSAKDFLDVAGSFPEIAAGILAVRTGRGLPNIGKLEGLTGIARDMLAGTAGAEGVGAAKDAIMAAGRNESPDLGEIASSRTKMAGVDLAVGGLTYPVGRFFQFMKNPAAGSRGPVQFDAAAAREYFKGKYGVDIPATVGESTGSPLLQRTESFLEKLPGGNAPIQQVKAAREKALREAQAAMMGAPAGTDEEVGQAVSQAISEKTVPVKESIKTAQAGLAQTAENEIGDTISKLTMPERQLYASKTGADVRNKVIGLRDAAKAKADELYGAVKSLPGGSEKAFSADGLADDAQKILKNLPTKEKTIEELSYDAYGSPILRTTQGKEVLREFVPPNVLGRLQALTGLKGQSLRLDELQQMRREVYDDIAKGEAVPGIGTHYLNDIGKALTKSIEEGVEKLPTGELKTALQTANEHYKKNVLPFNRSGIAEFFRESDAPGYLGDAEIVRRYLSGAKAVDNFNILKETLGEKSPEFTRLKRTIADSILENSRLPGENTLDADSLIKNLSNFQREHREIADSIFGNQAFKLTNAAEFLRVAQGAKVDRDKLVNLLLQPGKKSESLSGLMAEQAKLDTLYKNKLVKAIDAGELTNDVLNPADFVNRFVDTARPDEVRQFMGLLHDKPEVVDAIRSKTIEKVLRDASRQAGPEDLNLLLSDERSSITSGTRIGEQLKDKTVQQKLKTILGDGGFQDLKQYMAVEAGKESAETAFAAAGGIAAGTQIANLTKRGPLKYLTEAAKDYVAAFLLSHRATRAWLSRVPGDPGSISLILTSPQVFELIVGELGPEGARDLIRTAKGSIDRYVTQDAQKVQPDHRREQFQQFLNQ